ncbi:MAG: PHP domain-containing protein [Armatimonadia bacterium]|nr:PHP domain-containing protein [Armatimonadia bacterium]
MIVDIHCHTRAYSGCAIDSLEDMVRAAVGRGLGALCVTEHDVVYPADRARQQVRHLLNGMPVFRGIEVSCYGPKDIMAHIIVLGREDMDGPCYRPRRLRELADEAGAALVLAHPFRYRDDAHHILDHLPVDAIEVDSSNVDDRAAAKALDLADRAGLPAVAGSDAHRASDVGAYATRLERVVSSVEDLAKEIRAGRVWPVRRDPETGDWE